MPLVLHVFTQFPLISEFLADHFSPHHFPDKASASLWVMTKTKRSSDDRLLPPLTSQRATKHALRRQTGCAEGQSGHKVTKVSIDENKIWRTGSRKSVFVHVCLLGRVRGFPGNEGICLKGRDRMASHLSGLCWPHCCLSDCYSAKIQGPFMRQGGNYWVQVTGV